MIDAARPTTTLKAWLARSSAMFFAAVALLALVHVWVPATAAISAPASDALEEAAAPAPNAFDVRAITNLRKRATYACPQSVSAFSSVFATTNSAWYPLVSAGASEHSMCTDLRLAVFIGNIAHETARLTVFLNSEDGGAGALHMIPSNWKYAFQGLGLTYDSTNYGNNDANRKVMLDPNVMFRVAGWWFYSGASIVMGNTCSGMYTFADALDGSKPLNVDTNNRAVLDKVNRCIYGNIADPGAEQRFRYINDAYQALKNQTSTTTTTTRMTSSSTSTTQTTVSTTSSSSTASTTQTTATTSSTPTSSTTKPSTSTPATTSSVKPSTATTLTTSKPATTTPTTSKPATTTLTTPKPATTTVATSKPATTTTIKPTTTTIKPTTTTIKPATTSTTVKPATTTSLKASTTVKPTTTIKPTTTTIKPATTSTTVKPATTTSLKASTTVKPTTTAKLCTSFFCF
ncbi:hypothetical protein AMAG_03679 [Allomyces macrogynus ATCC 38327]|uniref:Chitinase n=1 Tax=Allomyces macrogynus (strain ATCC 38327) TaxID=578462 RepID=A0A0L0SA86_ALLM3|nr:hypothetical protein AMAG_03679 [Allomyces macrogynus ATCC 38327]|eukprot:KNE59396.1 hypothetical protein AMAG_03679 [Allomyces macrogynus ATCC 38327]